MLKKKLNKINTMSHRARYTFYEEMFREYVNNFITLSKFAEYYGIDNNVARTILDCGEIINNNYTQFLGE